MNYPNAAKGLHRIVISEIIALISSIIAVVVSVLAFSDEEALPEDGYTFGVISIVMLVIIGLYIAAYVLQIFGIILASKDEPAFKVSLYAIITAIILTVLSGVFYENETVAFVISIAQDVAQFFLVHYIIHGIMHLSHHLDRPEIAKRGTYIFRVIYIAIIFEVIVRFIEIIYGKEGAETIGMPFDIVANILKTIEYILFLIYIIKGSKMLKEKQPE